jgi:hypothetical protein
MNEWFNVNKAGRKQSNIEHQLIQYNPPGKLSFKLLFHRAKARYFPTLFSQHLLWWTALAIRGNNNGIEYLETTVLCNLIPLHNHYKTPT